MTAAEKLDFSAVYVYQPSVSDNTFLDASTHTMFDDLFDFSKKRTLKQSIGFFIFHSGLVITALVILSAMGVA